MAACFNASPSSPSTLSAARSTPLRISSMPARARCSTADAGLFNPLFASSPAISSDLVAPSADAFSSKSYIPRVSIPRRAKSFFVSFKFCASLCACLRTAS